MKNSLFLLLIIVACQQQPILKAQVSAETASKEIIGNLTNSEAHLEKPYIILVSIDGFRYDYAERYGAKNLLSFDVKAEKMIPSFPSKTFPNHYAIATGLYPGHNGLVSNSFYDRKLDITYSIGNRGTVENPAFYNGTPLWVLTEQQKMVSGIMFWVGSEAPIKSTLPTYYYKYDGKVPHEDRVNQAIKWLQLPPQERPHFISLYFSKIDDLGHKYGPDAKEVELGVKEMDELLGELVSKVDQLDLAVNIIIVSDHGMLEVDRDNLIYLEDLVPSDMKITTNYPAMVYSDDSERIDSLYQSLSKQSTYFDVYLKNNVPDWYHYDTDQNRIGDLIIMPKPPYTFSNKEYTISKGSSTHGFDPRVTPEMGAIFYAKGPAFNKIGKIAPFENVHIYPLIAEILELDYEKDSIDGSINVLLPILK